MRSTTTLPIVVFLMACILLGGVFSPSTQAQGNPPDARIIIKRVASPVLPEIARIANVDGDVVVTVGLRPDGTVAVAVVNEGTRLLQQAALESARASEFECRGCRIGITEYSILYRFRRTPDTHCLGEKSDEQIIQTDGEITVIDQGVAICDPGAEIGKVRSIKCLFLWKCAYHRF